MNEKDRISWLARLSTNLAMYPRRQGQGKAQLRWIQDQITAGQQHLSRGRNDAIMVEERMVGISWWVSFILMDRAPTYYGCMVVMVITKAPLGSFP